MGGDKERGWIGVLRTDSTEVVHGPEGSVEVLAADVLVVDVDAVRGEFLQRLARLDLLVVEALVEIELLLDEVELVVAADAADDRQALVFGELAHQLADGTGRGGDEDRLALLGHADVVETRVGRQTGHAQGADEELGVELVGVVQFLQHVVRRLLRNHGVFFRSEHARHDISFLEFGVVGFEHLRNNAVGDRLTEVEGRGVRFRAWGSHAAALVGVEGGIEVFRGDAVLGRFLVEVEVPSFNGQVFPRDRPSGRDVFEDETFILDHDGDLSSFERGGGNNSD